MEICAFGLLLLVAFARRTVKRHADVLHGDFVEPDFSKRLWAVTVR
jgi:hypothetical protein